MFVIIHGGSFVAYKIEDEGKIGKKLYYEKFEGNSKIHQIQFSKDYSELYIINMGLGELIKYEVLYNNNRLDLIKRDTFYFEKDSKPRHMVIDNQGYIYVVTEDSCEIYKLMCDDKNKLRLIKKVSILEKEKEQDDTGSAIKCDLEKKFIYVSIRGWNRIAVFSIKENGLEMVQNVDCKGECPRDIVLDSKNKYLFCANQKSNNISIFKIIDGKLKFEKKYSTIHPSCIVVD